MFCFFKYTQKRGFVRLECVSLRAEGVRVPAPPGCRHFDGCEGYPETRILRAQRLLWGLRNGSGQ